MAKRFAIKIPGMRKALTTNQLLWGAAGVLGIAGLYYIMTNRDTGIPIIDTTLGQVGDITGLSGRFAPPAPAIEAPVGEAGGWGDWRFANAYQGQTFDNFEEMRFSGAYKNE